MPPPVKTVLAPGQALHLPAPRGARILCTAGSLQVLPAAAWLGETMVAAQVMLHEGEQMIVQDTGWITLRARGGAALALLDPPPGLPGRLAAVLARLVRPRPGAALRGRG